MNTKEKAIKHYQEMIAWAETQEEKEYADYEKMLKAIGHCWYAKYCSYCIESDCNCLICSLSGSGNISINCCGYKWREMDRSNTWRTWIKNAKKVLEYIEINGR